LEYIFVEHF